MPPAELRLRLALVAGLLAFLPATTYVTGPAGRLISGGVLFLVLYGALWKCRKRAPRTVAVLTALLAIQGVFVWTSLAHVLVGVLCAVSVLLALSVLVPSEAKATTTSG